MANVERMRDSIPKYFKSVEGAAEFWDAQDLAADWDWTQEARCA